MRNDTICISGLMLRRTGGENNPSAKVVVELEIDGVWQEVAEELLESNFSTIIEPAGIRRIIATQAKEYP